MLERINQFFQGLINDSQSTKSTMTVELAAATLLCEVVRADDKTDERELQVLRNTLEARFNLQSEEVEELMQLANREAEQAVDHFQFVRLINDHFSEQEKIALVDQMWRIAYADGDLDPEEEWRVRKIADLLYVRHSDFIRTKQQVIQQQS